VEICIDYSFARPNPAAIRAAGVSGVMRYLSHSPAKNLSVGEAGALKSAGLWIGLNWESTATRVNTAGAGGGQTDARIANAMADQLGVPAAAAIFYSCDTAPNVAAARAYFLGVRSAGGRPVGWYGGALTGRILRSEGLVSYVWVANAASWSGFRHWDDMANAARTWSDVHMLQHVDRPLPGLDPGAYDLNEVLRPFPAWGRDLVPVPVKPKVMADMDLSGKFVSYLRLRQGAWLLSEDGGIFTLEGHFYGAPHGKPYWHGRKGARCGRIRTLLLG
jgi:hypothetical protein